MAHPESAAEAAPAAEGPRIADLVPQDKAKVGNLLRELARAQREGQQRGAVEVPFCAAADGHVAQPRLQPPPQRGGSVC